MARPDNLPAVVQTRHGPRNSADLNHNDGRPGAVKRDELWLQLTHGQAVAAVALVNAGQLPESSVWGIPTLNTADERVWEKVYDEPAVATPPVVAPVTRGR